MADSAIATSERAVRILTMIPLIRARPGIKIEELARILGCSPRTVLADLDAVLMCGVPPYLPNDYVGVCVEDGGVRLDFAGHFRRPVRLTLQEALSLRLALDSLPLVPASGAAKLRGRIERLLPTALRSRARTGFRVIPAARALHVKLRRLSRAVAENREVFISYYTASRDALTERTIRPYGLVELRGEWYVVGYCLLRQRELPFRVDRIRTLKVLPQRFTVPADFDIERYRRAEMYFPSGAEVQVRIRVAADLASRVRRAFAVPKIEELPNGDLCFSVRVSHPEWLLAWAIQYGPQVEILEPPELRTRMCQFCNQLLSIYAH